MFKTLLSIFENAICIGTYNIPNHFGIAPGWQFGGVLTPAIPYSLHREWRVGGIVLEDSMITRIDIPDGHIDVSRDGGGYGLLLCHRYVSCVRVEWYVKRDNQSDDETIIQTYP